MPEPIVTLNEEGLGSDLRELARKTVEDTLNGLLEAEADDLAGAERYERSVEREAYRAGQYDRSLTTSSGEVTIRMPKLKGALHDSDHRTLSQAGVLRRGGDDRDVSRRGLHQEDRGRLRDPLGGRASPPRRSRTSTRGCSRRSRSGGTARSSAPTPTSTSMGYT